MADPMKDNQRTLAGEQKPTSAGTSLDGYFYQLNVSVWIALDLLLEKRLAGELTLEPAQEDDLETEIEEEPDALTQKIAVQNYQLVVQCKRRTTGPWKHGEIGRLLAHGKRRTKPKERLADKRVRYLLVTSADLEGVARNLRVESAGEWPSQSIPRTMARDVPAHLAGRVAVLGSTTDEIVGFRTKRLLTERFKIPHTQLDECRAALRTEALDRMRGAGGGVWRRAELERVITRHDGFAGATENLDGFVPPTNWDELQQSLATQHAIVIKGASGTGKTSAAKALIAHLRDTIPGIHHEYVQGGPERIHGFKADGPVVFEIEDPWGRFRLGPNAHPWNDAIASILQSAGPNRKFVITSRSDILSESKPRALTGKWMIALEEENYGPRQRDRLFENRLARMPSRLQLGALKYKKATLERLTTPLEIDRYFAFLNEGPEKDEGEPAYINRCLTEAHHSSIEAALVRAAEAREEWALAAIVWGLFKARARLSTSTIPDLQGGLSRRSLKYEDTLAPFISRLVAGRNLRQVESILTYQHPRVELGLEQALNQKPGRAARALEDLLEVLVAIDERSDDWGKEGAALVLQAINSTPNLSVTPGPSLQEALDRWLEGRIDPAGDEFADDLKLAAAVGSSSSVASELARWLYHRASGLDWFDHDRWSLPARTDAWYAKVSAHPSTKPICESFVTRLMAHGHGSFPDDFAAHVSRFGFDPTPAFLQTALNVVGYGYFANDDAILEGAIADLDRFEEVIAAALAEQDSTREQSDDLLLALENGEYDEEAHDHYAEPDDSGHTASEFIKRYIDVRRSRDGWRAIAAHPGLEGLLWAWINGLRGQPVEDDQEWLALANHAIGHRHENRFWEAARGRLPEALLPALANRLRTGGGNASARISLLRTAAHDAPSMVEAVAQSLAQDGNNARIIEMAADIRQALDPKDDDEDVVAQARRLVERGLTPALQTAIKAVFDGDYRSFTPDAVKLFRDFVPSGLAMALLRAEVLAANGDDVRDDIEDILRHEIYTGKSDYNSVADAAKLAGELRYVSTLRRALAHSFADVREQALVGLAALSSGPLTGDLLALASDKGHRVKRKLVHLLSKRRHPEHLATLLELAADTWSNSRRQYNEDASFPIAQEAAKLLMEEPILEDSLHATFSRIIKETADTGVKLKLMQALVRNGTDLAREKILRLALKTGKPPLHRLAATALLLEHAFLSEQVVSEVSDEHLRLQAAPVACQLTMLVGACATPARVIEAAQALAVDPDRRALLVLLSLAASFRDKDLAAQVRQFLPGPLVPAVADAIAEMRPFKSDALNEVGDVRVLAAIKMTASTLFEEPKRQTAFPSAFHARFGKRTSEKAVS